MCEARPDVESPAVAIPRAGHTQCGLWNPSAVVTYTGNSRHADYTLIKRGRLGAFSSLYSPIVAKDFSFGNMLLSW
ncbi:hypothetical protein J6590_061218 [Homalodisca vitripennis]|nr:hypothetical protein J6590_061218 [Homalodisca vitripennis]